MYRIQEYEKGFVVEIRRTKNYIFFKRHYWTHFISVTGVPSEPWYFSSSEIAMKCLMMEVEYETCRNSTVDKIYSKNN